MNRVISLCDYSGQWPEPFRKRGWDVQCVDVKNGVDLLEFEDAGSALELFEDVHGVLSAPPCTHFTSSGAQYWPQKDEDGRTWSMLKLIWKIQAFVDLFTPTDPDYYRELNKPFFWALENPVGRLPKLVPGIGEAYYFDPYEFGGYLNLTDSDHNELDRLRRKDGKGFSWEEAMFVIDCNAYTKKTGLWGDFNRDLIKDPIEPVRCCKQGSPFQLLGGKTNYTKEIRSMTPSGFAEAFYQANHEWQADIFSEDMYRKFSEEGDIYSVQKQVVGQLNMSFY